MDPETFTGLPLVLASPGLDLGELAAPVGIAEIDLDETSLSGFDPIETLFPSDVLLAVVSSADHAAVLKRRFAQWARPTPKTLIAPRREEFQAALLRALYETLGDASRREADLRLALVALRQEAEESREILRSQLAELLARWPPHRLDVAFERPPADADAAISFTGNFELLSLTPIEISGLSSLHLHVSGGSFQPNDALSVQIHGAESGEIHAAWKVPAAALQAGEDWLALDLLLPIAKARETAMIVLSGSFSPESWIALSAAAASGDDEAPFALRLLRADAPRLARSPFWDWQTLSGGDSALIGSAASFALPDASWTNMRVLGDADFAALPSGARFGLSSGRSAMLIFPDVPLSDAVAVAATVRVHSGAQGKIVAAIALLPPEQEEWKGLAAAVSAAFLWSPIASIDAEPSSILLELGAQAPARAHVAIALRNEGAATNRFAVLSCSHVALIPPSGEAPAAPAEVFVTPSRRAEPLAVFEDVVLDGHVDGEDYRHLDMNFFSLMQGGSAWDRVKFKFFHFRNAAGLEFRRGRSWPRIFRQWPGQEADSYGEFYKINGAKGLSDALATLEEIDDRRLIASIVMALPHAVEILAARRDLSDDAKRQWMETIDSLQPGP